ncbi:MAG: hypothetical protein JSS14_20040 [Proteobacteria bacterium]|nr:hypothetical protein [Pseudomonadota bacterium]
MSKVLFGDWPRVWLQDPRAVIRLAAATGLALGLSGLLGGCGGSDGPPRGSATVTGNGTGDSGSNGSGSDNATPPVPGQPEQPPTQGPLSDPTSATDRAGIVPDTSAAPWYCRNGGSDYTLRLTYGAGSVRHRLLQGGLRPFNQPRGTPAASAQDPLSADSFRQFAVHVPADKPLVRVELLSTPMAWEGLAASPPVLADLAL